MKFWLTLVLACALPLACGDDDGGGSTTDASVTTTDSTSSTVDGNDIDNDASGTDAAIGDLTEVCGKFCDFTVTECMQEPDPECQTGCETGLGASGCSGEELGALEGCLEGACDESVGACIDAIPCLHAAECGDGTCEGDENASNCADDCEAECGNNACEPGECDTCAADCAAETCATCETYCEWTVDACMDKADPTCLDGCVGALTSFACTPRDLTQLEECFDPECADDDGACFNAVPCLHQPMCGDALCEGEETNLNCSSDCPATCGNTVCEVGECETCAGDCNAAACSACSGFCSWNVEVCEEDADPACQANCVGQVVELECDEADYDIISDCIDAGTCDDTTEACFNTAPCLHVPQCGDQICEGEETAETCFADCAVCGDNMCSVGECGDCEQDCPEGCTCEHTTCAMGAALDPDCGECEATVCAADDYCCTTEWDATCRSEAVELCELTCPVECGDGFCEGNETFESCAADCEDPCSHEVCEAGGALASTCGECEAAVCAADDYCCTTEWDSTCVGEVAEFCEEACPGDGG